MPLVIKDQQHLEKVVDYCQKKDILKPLLEKFEYLEHYGCSVQDPERTRCTLSPDISDKHSFHVVMERKNKMTGKFNLIFIGSLYYDQNEKPWHKIGWKLTTQSF